MLQAPPSGGLHYPPDETIARPAGSSSLSPDAPRGESNEDDDDGDDGGGSGDRGVWLQCEMRAAFMVLWIYIVYASVIFLLKLVSSNPRSVIDFIRHELDGCRSSARPGIIDQPAPVRLDWDTLY